MRHERRCVWPVSRRRKAEEDAGDAGNVRPGGKGGHCLT